MVKSSQTLLGIEQDLENNNGTFNVHEDPENDNQGSFV